MGDRPRLGLDLSLLVFFSVGCVAARPLPPSPTSVEQYVSMDGSADGDGSKAHPWRQAPSRVAPNVVLHLSSGVYLGPMQVEGSVIGSGQVVVTATDATVLTCIACRLQNISVQGGRRGVEVTSGAQWQDLTVTGAQEASVVIHSGRVSGERTRLEGTLTGSTGLVVEQNANVTMNGLKTSGAYVRAVENQGGRITLTGWEHGQGGFGLRSVGGEVSISRSHLGGGRGTGLFITHGQAALNQVQVERFDTGLEVGVESTVVADELVVERSSSGGISSTNASLTLRNSRVDGSGALGCVLVNGGTTRLEQMTLTHCQTYGALLRLTNATVDQLQVELVSGEGESLGDGLQLRDGTFLGSAITVSDVAGAGLWASALATVQLARLEVTRAAAGGVVVERKATLTADTLVIQGSPAPALSVIDGGKASVRRLVSSHPSAPAVWLECGVAGTHLRVASLEAPERLAPKSCLELLQN